VLHAERVLAGIRNVQARERCGHGGARRKHDRPAGIFK
jgi:hypothetical protein